MQIKKLSELEALPGLNKTETALVLENNLNFENFKKLFPDFKKELDGLTLIIRKLSKLKKSNDFADYIIKNRDKKFCVIGDYDKK